MKGDQLSLPPVTQSQILAASDLNKHHLGAEEELLHDVSEEAGIDLRIGQFVGESAAVPDELVTARCLVTVQGQDGYTEVRTGSLGVGKIMSSKHIKCIFHQKVCIVSSFHYCCFNTQIHLFSTIQKK